MVGLQVAHGHITLGDGQGFEVGWATRTLNWAGRCWPRRIPGEAPAPRRTARSDLHSIWRIYRHYALRYWAWYLGGFACLVLTNWIAVRIPMELGLGVDALKAGDPAVVGHSALVIGLLGLAVIVVRTLSRALVFTPGRLVEYDVRNGIFRHVMRLQPRDLLRHGAGDIISRASNDITMARALVGFGTLQAVNITAALAFTGSAMFRIDGWLTLWVLAPVLLATFLVQGAIRALFRLTRRVQAHLAALSDQVLASFQGVGTVQAFGAEAAFQARFEEHNAAWLAGSLRMTAIGAAMQPALAASSALAVYLLLVVGGRRTIEGSLTVGQMVAFTTYLLYLVPPLRSLGWLIAVVQRGRASLERIFEVLDLVPDRPDLDGEQAELPGEGALGFSLRGLHFSYPDAPEEVVLHGIHAEIPAGATVGIFGRTGSGKTTLLRVLARLYNPPPGSVFLRGGSAEVDLLRVDLDGWRQRLGVVPQEPFLFTDSIASNVSLGAERQDGRVGQVLREAALLEDLHRLPDGMETRVGERGIMLSGGQRQRVALARGFYRHYPVLMLDDVLSAVDHATEGQLIESLRARGAGGAGGQRPTVLLVSHRISALTHADWILVLEAGRLVDQGKHADLAARPGIYRDTWLKQVQGGEGEGAP